MKELFFTETNSHLFLIFVFIHIIVQKYQFFVIMNIAQFRAKTVTLYSMGKIMQNV